MKKIPLLVLSLVLLGAGPPDDPLELTNPLLGPAYAQWLVGAIAHMATEQERQSYLRLRNDQAAQAFIDAFWQRHQGLIAPYEHRAEEADRRFTEAAYPGRRTDRGTIFILYGEPDSIEYEEFRAIEEPTVERWRYDKDRPVGLDDERPKRQYRFAKSGDLTRFFKGGRSRPPRPDPSQPPRLGEPDLGGLRPPG